MRVALPASGFSAAAKLLVLLCALLQIYCLPYPALAEPLVSDSAGTLRSVDEARFFLRAVAVFMSAQRALDGTLPAMGEKRRETGMSLKTGSSAASEEYADASFLRSAFEGSFFGALFFGYTYQGIGSLDLAALALIGFLFVWCFAPGRKEKNERESGLPKRESAQPDRQNDALPGQGARRQAAGVDGRNSSRSDYEQGNRGNSFGRLLTRRRSESAEEKSVSAWRNAREKLPAPPELFLPDAFDSEEFLEGARVLYIRVQEACSARDTENLAPFMTPEMMRLLREQKAAHPRPKSIKIILLKASLIDLEQEEDADRVKVAFSLLAHTDNGTPDEIHELWHFVRGRSNNTMWRLAAMDVGSPL